MIRFHLFEEYLKQTVSAVIFAAVEADGGAAVQAEDVLLVLLYVLV